MRWSLKIESKIWLSLSILILGYFTTMLVGFFLGQKTEQRLSGASEALFPASIQSQAALIAFKEQLKLYQDAILMGDQEMITTAQKKSQLVKDALENIVSLDGLDPNKKERVKGFVQRIEDYTGEAQPLYDRLSKGEQGEAHADQAIRLAKVSEELEKMLVAAVQTFAGDLKAELTDISRNTKQQRYTNLFVFFGVVICAIVAVTFIVRKFVSGPIKKTVTMIKDVAEGEGDLTRRLKINSKDEIGELAQWFNQFLEKLQNIVRDIADNSKMVESSSADLLTISGEMSNTAVKTSDLATTVAAGTEAMSTNLNGVAAAMDESSNNANMVATASEEMNATINEIARNSEKARQISNTAVTQAKSAGDRMTELGNSAQDIGKITETITEISEQTNLLSLNATIEAARAGEAGKGFAVVANEIKELAKQTAGATQDIKSKIQGVQQTTTSTVSEIDEISNIINEVNEIVGGIATAIEEQSVATREIAENIGQTSRGIEQVNANVNKSSEAATRISSDITNVKSSAKEITDNSNLVNSSAENLKNMAEKLDTIVNSFKV